MTEKVGRVPDGTGLSQAEPSSTVSALTGFDPSRIAGHLHDDVIPALEWILDEERIEYDECPCGDYALCGAGPCNDFGCVVDKLAEAKALYAIAMEAHQGRNREAGSDPKDDSAGPQDIAQP